MGKSLVIVESPAKAKTINRYLGNDFIVKSSVGHIRDLPTGASRTPSDPKEFHQHLLSNKRLKQPKQKELPTVKKLTKKRKKKSTKVA